jgi:hypothetical protein
MTRFVIPMPGWSAPMVATSVHRGFFISIAEPAIHHFARFLDALAFMCRKKLRGYRSVRPGGNRVLEYAL